MGPSLMVCLMSNRKVGTKNKSFGSAISLSHEDDAMYGIVM
jgi:hypothetical protein